MFPKGVSSHGRGVSSIVEGFSQQTLESAIIGAGAVQTSKRYYEVVIRL